MPNNENKQVSMTSNNSDLPSVYFNHLYIVLNDKTYRAIQASDFLRTAFSGMESRSTLTTAGETWTGTYFYTRENYLEFFGESTGRFWKPASEEGWAGLAFSTDQQGGVEAVRQRITAELGYQPFHELRQLHTVDKDVNWFYHTKLAEPLNLDSFDAWVMEYHPDIFAHKGIPLPLSGQPTRHAYLSPWNQEESPKNGTYFRRPRVFNRLIGATIIMDPTRAALFSRTMQILGYKERQESGQVTLSAHGFDLTIRLNGGDGAPGYRISSLCLEMDRPSVAPMTFVFAPGSRLVLREDLKAEWIFGE
jgi:hypothetical protein